MSTKHRLISSAIDLMSNKSYNSVGVQDICNRAEVKKGSFYHFFPSKRDLTIEALGSLWDEYKNSVIIPIFESDKTPYEKLRDFFTFGYEHQMRAKSCTGCVSGCSFGNLSLELSTQDETIRKKIENIFDDWSYYIEKTIQEAISRGEISASVNVRESAQALIALAEGILLLCKTYNDPELIMKITDNLFEIIKIRR